MTRACACLEFLLDRVERVAAVGRKRGDHVGGHQIAAGDDVAELLDGPRGLGGVVGRKVGRAEDGVDLRSARPSSPGSAAATKLACALRSASYCFSCWAAASSRSCAAAPRLLMVSSMFLTVSVSAATTALSAPSSMISPSFSQRDLLGLLHLFGAFVQHLLAFGGQQRRSLAGKARALGGKLQAGGQPWECPVRSDRPCVSPSWPSTMPAPALITMAMPAITAKAANRLPLTPHRGRRKPNNLPRLPIENRHAMSFPPAKSVWMNRGGSIALPG